MSASTATYRHEGRLYVNMTNRCPVECAFCAKKGRNWDYRGTDLRISNELGDAALEQEVFQAAETDRPPEIVFCGYGEPTYRLPALIRICERMRAQARRPSLRLNTIGLGGLIWGRDIVPDLIGRLDAVSVSLNTADPEQWLRLHRPLPAFRARGYEAVLAFIGACFRAGLDTTVTAVDLPGVDLDGVARAAAVLGARFRPRPRLPEHHIR